MEKSEFPNTEILEWAEKYTEHKKIDSSMYM